VVSERSATAAGGQPVKITETGFGRGGRVMTGWMDNARAIVEI
jgi:hypothetical protein